MEQFPFAVDNSDPSSPIVAAAAGGDDSSSLVTASSQGSFVPTSEEDHAAGMMHSSLQQHTDDENDLHNHNHDAVFANLTQGTPVTVQQPHLLPIEPINFGATIVELPPPAPHILPVSHRPCPTTISVTPPAMNTSLTTPPSSLLSGVDALKSAGSRVTSVLSNLGYNLGINSGTNTTVATSSAPTIRSSNTTSTIVAPVSKQHYEPPTDNSTPKLANIEEAANDFAYINVTDEDEVDVWLDENHASTNRDDATLHGNSNNADTIHRGNVLAILLANDTSPPISLHDTAAASRPSLTPGEELVHFTEQANTMTSQAVQARKNGNLQMALDRHSDAAKLYHQAALQIRDKDGT